MGLAMVNHRQVSESGDSVSFFLFILLLHTRPSFHPGFIVLCFALNLFGFV